LTLAVKQRLQPPNSLDFSLFSCFLVFESDASRELKELKDVPKYMMDWIENPRLFGDY
jgi:hypothetical protein